MPENTKNLVLEHLRHVRGTLDRIDQPLADLATRLISAHRGIVHMRYSVHCQRNVSLNAAIVVTKTNVLLSRLYMKA